MNVTEGIVRARFRASIWEAPKLLTPGEVYEYTIANENARARL